MWMPRASANFFGRGRDDRRQLARLGRHSEHPHSLHPDEQRVDRLAAVDDDDLDLGPVALEGARRIRSPSPGRHRRPRTSVTSSPPADSSRRAPRGPRPRSRCRGRRRRRRRPRARRRACTRPAQVRACFVADRHRAVAGRHGRAGHRDDVGVHRPGGVEHGEGGERLHGRARRHDVDVTPSPAAAWAATSAAMRVSRSPGSSTTARDPGPRPPRGAGRPRPGARAARHDDRAGVLEHRAMPGPAAQATTRQGHGRGARGDLGGEVGDPDPFGPARRDAGLDRRAGSSTWTWTFHSSGPPTTSSESPSASRVARSTSTASGVASSRRYITS